LRHLSNTFRAAPAIRDVRLFPLNL
jgi:hypothetical protein